MDDTFTLEEVPHPNENNPPAIHANRYEIMIHANSYDYHDF